jgi:hypothetical protein
MRYCVRRRRALLVLVYHCAANVLSFWSAGTVSLPTTYHPSTFSAPVRAEPSIDPEPEGDPEPDPDPDPPLPPVPLGTHCVPLSLSETSSVQPISQDETRHLESTHRTSATPSSAVQSTPWPSEIHPPHESRVVVTSRHSNRFDLPSKEHAVRPA